MKVKKTFLLVTLISLLFSGCNNLTSSIIFEDQSGPKDKALLTICLDDSDSKTAMPIFNWNDFTYELIAVQNPGEPTQKAPVTLFTDRTYEQLVMGIPLEAAKYRFTLNAYKNSQKALSGTETVDLSMGNTQLLFIMYATTGSKGSANVKITYPKTSPVSKISAYVSEGIFDEKQGTDLTLGQYEMGNLVATYRASDLTSGKEQYAIIKFFDVNNTLIYSCAESLIVVGGCTSSSEITLTNDDWHTYMCSVILKKDNAGWESAGKTVSLVNKTDNNKVYVLREKTGGEYYGSVAEGIYNVYVDDFNTGIEFNSVNKSIDVDFYTVSMTPVKNSTMIPVSASIEKENNYAVVLKNNDFVYQIKLSQGYECSSLVVKQNGTAVPNAAFDTDIKINSVTAPIVITDSGITPITYHITYRDADGASFETKHESGLPYWYKYGGTYTPPTEYTAENTVLMPAIENIRKDGSYFDAWTDESGATIIDTENIYRDLVLTAHWRSAPTPDDENKIIYANGFNLLIKEENSETHIYIDYNGDGIKNNDDTQITCKNLSTSKDNDFTGYELHAGNSLGTYVPKSDFTFTMTGGTISAIYGLNSKDNKYTNKSTLNISGNAKIGEVGTKTTVTNANSTKTVTADYVKGIMLDTLSDKRVNIVGQMTSPYSVTCVTEDNYDHVNEHIVAYIANSKYAQFNYFTCWNIKTEEDKYGNEETIYTNIILTQKSVIENGITRTLIRMTEDAGVNLPGKVVIDELGEFNFADNETVTINCSVFSIAVTNGSFRMTERTTITNNESTEEINAEKSMTYMAQPDARSYVEQFDYSHSYIYMQVISSGNLLTPKMATDFIKQLQFKKNVNGEEMVVTVNLESVDASEIRGTGTAENPEYKYFNGSFYKWVDGNEKTVSSGNNKGKKSCSWSTAYNGAKQQQFNGLTGYLINLTSLVENNYIFFTFNKIHPNELSWTGGTVFVPRNSIYDIAKFEAADKTRSTAWRWMAGPEAGMIYWNYPTCMEEGQKELGETGVDCNFQRWRNSKYIFTSPEDYTSDKNDVSKPLRGDSSSEPNGKEGTTTNEPCMQFVSGLLSGLYAEGFWNNKADAAEAGDYATTGYIVEFTPYETQYGVQTASKQAIKRTAKY